MQLNDEIILLEHYSRTMHLVVASLTAAREELKALPNDARWGRLGALHQQAIDAANESLSFSSASLTHARSVGNLYAVIQPDKRLDTVGTLHE